MIQLALQKRSERRDNKQKKKSKSLDVRRAERPVWLERSEESRTVGKEVGEVGGEQIL